MWQSVDLQAPPWRCGGYVFTFQRTECGFDPWSKSWDPTCLRAKTEDRSSIVTLAIKTLKTKVVDTQLCLTVCNPMDCRPSGSSFHVIFQVRILGWVPIPFSRASSQPRDRRWVSCIAGRFFTVLATRDQNISKKEKKTSSTPVSVNMIEATELDSVAAPLLFKNSFKRGKSKPFISLCVF